MSLTKNLHPDEKYKAGKLGTQMTLVGLGLIAVMGILSLILGAVHKGPGGEDDHFKRFLYAYVTSWAWIASLSIGMLWLVLLHHLTRSRWSTVVRRIAEAMTGAFPIIWLAGLGFVLPVLFGYKDLYYWAHPDAAKDPLIAHKLGWLSPGMFTMRYVIYGAIYIGISTYFSKKSREQDDSGDPKISITLRRASGPGMILFSITTCALAFDVLMSLAPKWYSTIYGVMFWGSGNIAAFAALALIVLWLQRNGRLVHSVNEEHYHDIGKWMFSFTFFWAYTAFSQFMLQWYGNMPEETNWYKYRMFGDWQWVSIAILVGYWAFPFVFLMSRWTKRIVPSLVFFAVWQLVFHWLDMYWDTMPQYDWTMVGSHNAGPLAGPISLHHVGFTAVDITTWLALIGFFLVGTGRGLKGNLIPVKDPTLGLSLAHEQL
ncbi:MAG TPA: hypothetical protein VGL61_26895 [Kofleriaceae bacterium]|jgi:hypothetical protein